MKLKKIIPSILVTITFSLLFTCGEKPIVRKRVVGEQPIRLTYAGGFLQGTYHQMGRTMNSLPYVQLEVLETKGSKENIKLITTGKADIGLVQFDVYIDYMKRFPKLRKVLKIVIPIYAEEVHYISKKKYKWPSRLSRARISIGPDGSGIQDVAKKIFRTIHYNTNRIHIDKSPTKIALQKLLNNEIDGMFIVAGAPIKLLADLGPEYSSKIKLLSFNKTDRNNLVKRGSPFKKRTIRLKTYKWLEKRAKTIAIESILIARNDVSGSDISRLITKMFQNRIELLLSHQKWSEFKTYRIKRFMKNKKPYFHPAALKVLNKL